MQLHLTIDLRAVILGFVLLLVAAGIATPFAISLADDGLVGETSSAQPITAGTAFTYQGLLDVTGVPANGIYDFRFTLFDADTAGSAVAGPLSVNNVNVGDGLFTVTLDFGAAPFAGSERWLVVEAKATASQTFDALTPRQPLTPVPYALFALSGGTQYTAGTGLTLTGTQFSVQFLGASAVNGTVATAARSDHTHFGQAWSGAAGTGLAVANTSGIGLLGESATNYGVYGQSVSAPGVAGFSSTNYGVLGFSSSNTGVVGTSSSGRGVVGESATNTAVLGASVSGVGVVGESTSNYGVRGESTSNAGVYGQSPQGYGVNGVSTSSIGVRGESSTHAGVRGISASFVGVLGSSSSNFGVQGSSTVSTGVYGTSGSGYAGYFNGDVGIPANRDCYCSILPPSDLRLKRNIRSAGYGLAATLELLPRSYRWNEETDDEDIHLGFIAQEVQVIMPELVKESRDGMLALDYIGIIPVLTKAIQEQQAQIEALRDGSEPRPSGALDTATNVDAEAPPSVQIIRQSVGPSNAAIYVGAGSVFVFALGLFAVAWRRPRIV
jgi:hypothetical protein